MASGINPVGVVDYIVIITMLFITVLTGLYYGLYKGGQTTTQQYLLADRSVWSLPVALTILASFVSPLTLLGVPGEVYANGAEYIIAVLQDFLMWPTVMIFFVPVFYGLDITTSYEYLRRRFGYPMQCFGAVMFIIQNLFYSAIVMFTPALAIEAVTGFGLWLLILLTGAVSTFYTTMGGLSAVIWTDAFMAIIILVTTILLIITGTIATGGLAYVWDVNEHANRTDLFQFPLDPTERFTFPNMMIGTYFTSLALFGVSQTAVQRFLSTKSLTSAQTSVILNLPFVSGLFCICGLQGLVMYAFYNGINPVDGTVRGSPNITSSDQITVYFVSEQFGHIPGFQGLYISCIVAGSLSTISSSLNALASVTLMDIIRPIRQWRTKNGREVNTDPRESRDTKISKVMVAVYGTIALALSYVSIRLGTLVSLFNTLFGAIGGPLVGSFVLGMTCKRANTYGVLLGSVSGFLVGVLAIIGSQIQAGERDTFILFKISFQWYSVITISTTMLIAIVMSEFFRWYDPKENIKDIDPALLSTFLRDNKAVKKKCHENKNITNLEDSGKLGDEFKQEVQQSATFL